MISTQAFSHQSCMASVRYLKKFTEDGMNLSLFWCKNIFKYVQMRGLQRIHENVYYEKPQMDFCFLLHRNVSFNSIFHDLLKYRCIRKQYHGRNLESEWSKFKSHLCHLPNDTPSKIFNLSDPVSLTENEHMKGWLSGLL